MEHGARIEPLAVESNQVHRTFDLLEFLARSGQPRSLAEITDHVDSPKSTVHRLLATMVSRGYVARDDRTQAYSIGLRCFELGSLWAQNLDLRSVALPHLTTLNQATGETTHLAVYDHGDVVYIEKLETTHAVVAISHIGRRCPAPYVATGRALLAYQSADEIHERLAAPLPRYTAQSVVEPKAVEEVLAKVRENGYAVNHGGYRDGVGGVAAPVRDHTGRVVASIGLCIPEERFTTERFNDLMEQTVDAAVKTSMELGGPSEPIRFRATKVLSGRATTSSGIER